MIKELENNELLMWAGDTGTISFNITGDCQVGDAYTFIIKKSLNDTPLFSQTFVDTQFTVSIDENISQVMAVGEYYWGVKLERQHTDGKEIDTIIGRGILRVKRGV